MQYNLEGLNNSIVKQWKCKFRKKKKQSSDVLDYFFEIVNSMDYRIYKEGRNNEKKPKMEKKVFFESK